MGKYKKRLYKTFFISSITLVSIIVFTLSLNFFQNQKNQYLTTINQISVNRAHNSDFALNIITKTLAELTRTPELKEWSTTKDSTKYYYNSLRIYQNLKRLSTNLSLLDYGLSVTILDDYSSVLSQDGSYPKDIFFKSETSLAKEQVDYLFHYFKYNSTPLTLSSYQDQQLKSLYYMTKQAYDDSAILFIVEIPYKTLFGKDYDQAFIIHDGHKIVASNGIDDSQDELKKYIVADLEQKDTSTHLWPIQDSLIFSSDLSTLGWKIAYVYKNISLSFSKVLIYFVLPLFILIILALIASKFITEGLYKPIKEVISEISTEDANLRSLDEFKILKQNTYKLSRLSKQLQDTIEENDLLVYQKFYRGASCIINLAT